MVSHLLQGQLARDLFGSSWFVRWQSRRCWWRKLCCWNLCI